MGIVPKNSGLTSVVSQIEDPFRISENTFPLDVFMNATLYVPKGTMGNYMNTEGWKKFLFIEEGTGGVTPTPKPQKCQKPTISCSRLSGSTMLADAIAKVQQKIGMTKNFGNKSRKMR